MLRVRLLGELALEFDGEELPLPRGRPGRTLLAWLALHPGMHARSRLAARLWPAVLDESARASLRNALAALRRALPEAEPQLLVATREQIGLASEVWVDVRAFEELAASDRLEEALALSRRELLPELDDDWVCDAREEHRDRKASVLAALADAAERRGQLDRAVERSRELAAIGPLSEEGQREFIRRLAAAGDRAGALAAYNRFQDRVRQELGLAPSQQTRALVERLRRETHPPGDVRIKELPLPLPLARQLESRMVGRQAELEELREAWERARKGERRLALVAGEAGIGKTRLVAELADVLHAAGGAVLYGRAYEDPLIAYQPFVEALGPWLAEANVVHSELSRLHPALAAEGSWSVEAEGARFRLFESVSSLLASVSRERPVLLVLEDLHWADKPTLLLLAHLVRAPDSARLLLVGTYRDGDLAVEHPLTAVVAKLRRERLGERFTLRGLEAAEVGELVGERSGAAVSADLARAVHRRTEGNPFFVEELVRHLPEAGGGAGGARAVEQVGVPEGVKELIGDRVARLDTDAVDVLRIASVLGREFDVRPLEEVVEGVTAERVLEALERAVSAELVREDPEAVGRYGFAHALVRETLYSSLSAIRCARLHARVAEILERLYGGVPERLGELAHHLLEAAAPDTAERAAEYGTRAGETALAQLAYEQAAAHFERALAALDLSPRPAGLQRCELLLALADARMRACDSDEARGAFAQAAAVARALGGADLLARAALGFGGIAVTIIDVDQSTVDLLEEALRAVAGGEAALRARLLARLAVELYYGPSRDRSESLSEQAIKVALRSGEERALSYALNARHVALWRPDRLRERLEIAREMIAVSDRAGDRESELQGRNWLVTDLFEAGEMEQLKAAIDAYEQLAKQLRLPTYEWYAPLWRAAIATLEGAFSEAHELVGEARQLGRRAGDANAGLLADMVDYAELVARGRPDLIIGRHRELLTQKASTSPAALSYAAGWSWCFSAVGDMPAAREHFERVARDNFAHVPFDVNRLDTLAACADACSALGDAERAAILRQLLVPFADRHACGAGRALGSWGSIQRPLALLCAAMGCLEDAEEHFDAALEANRALGWRPWLTWTQYQYAGMLVARGAREDGERASRLLAEAIELAHELGLDGLEKRVRTLKRRMARERPPTIAD